MSTAIGEGAGLNWRFKYSNHISWQGWEGIKKKNLSLSFWINNEHTPKKNEIKESPDI